MENPRSIADAIFIDKIKKETRMEEHDSPDEEKGQI